MKKSKRRNPYNIEDTMIVHNITKEEATKKVAELRLRTSNSLDGFIYRFGKEEGPERYKQYKENRSKSNPYNVEYIMKKHNITREKALDKVNGLKSKTSGTLDNFIKRHGKRVGKRRYKEFANKSKHTLETFTDKYGKSRGSFLYKEYLATKDSSSLEFHIRKYGEHFGPIKFKEKSKLSDSRSIEALTRRHGYTKAKILYEEMLNNMVDKGMAVPRGMKDDFKYYRNKCKLYINKLDISNLPNYDKYEENIIEYHRDHIYSVYDGFLFNIPLFIINNILNIQIIKAHDNISKGNASHMTRQELIEGFYNGYNKDRERDKK